MLIIVEEMFDEVKKECRRYNVHHTVDACAGLLSTGVACRFVKAFGSKETIRSHE